MTPDLAALARRMLSGDGIAGVADALDLIRDFSAALAASEAEVARLSAPCEAEGLISTLRAESATVRAEWAADAAEHERIHAENVRLRDLATAIVEAVKQHVAPQTIEAWRVALDADGIAAARAEIHATMRGDIKSLNAEVTRLRKLVEEACDIALSYAEDAREYGTLPATRIDEIRAAITKETP